MRTVIKKAGCGKNVMKYFRVGIFFYIFEVNKHDGSYLLP